MCPREGSGEMLPNDEFHLYDTTLRDGAQREGISYSVKDKLAIAMLLDDFGVGFIEGGWPGALVLAGAGILRSELVMRYSVRWLR